MPGVRQGVQRQGLPQQPPEDPQGQEGVRLSPLPQTLQPEGGLQHAPQDSHG